ncbi:hypothetical protein DM992_30775 [Burkholderia sp. JP2-270]|nr:hypothetical protein DM992_30775 [Burkholderia sp. JP2-270]
MRRANRAAAKTRSGSNVRFDACRVPRGASREPRGEWRMVCSACAMPDGNRHPRAPLYRRSPPLSSPRYLVTSSLPLRLLPAHRD